MTIEQKVLHSPFDIEIHKKTFINYLEVIIDENGTVHYAVPSHQEFLIKFACNKLCVDRDTLNEMCPKEYYFDFITWLCKITGCIAVWDKGIQGRPNRAQLIVLNKLRCENLYKGAVT